MVKQKYYLALTTEEWRLMIECLNKLRNRDMGSAASSLSEKLPQSALHQLADKRQIEHLSCGY